MYVYCFNAHMYVCMFVCMYVCMNICMYVYVCAFSMLPLFIEKRWIFLDHEVLQVYHDTLTPLYQNQKNNTIIYGN